MITHVKQILNFICGWAINSTAITSARVCSNCGQIMSIPWNLGWSKGLLPLYSNEVSIWYASRVTITLSFVAKPSFHTNGNASSAKSTMLIVSMIESFTSKTVNFFKWIASGLGVVLYSVNISLKNCHRAHVLHETDDTFFPLRFLDSIDSFWKLKWTNAKKTIVSREKER